MPITLNHSNIGVQYSTGSNYIIETVKSDLYRRNENYDNILRDNIQTAPVIPTTYVDSSGNVYAVESYTYSGTANTADYTRVFTKNTTCDILVVGGGGGGGKRHGGGGGAGTLMYHKNIILNGTYNIKVGKGGAGHPSTITTTTSTALDGNPSQFVKSDGTQNYYAVGGGRGTGSLGPPNAPPYVYANTNGGQGFLYDSNLTLSPNNIFNGVPVVVSNKQYVNTLPLPEGCRGNIGGIQINDAKGGGGGGAGGAGMNHGEESTSDDGYGGLGLAIDISGKSVVYAGGGNGTAWQSTLSQVFDPSYPTIESRGGGGFGSETGTPQNGLDGTGGGGGAQGNDTAGNPSGAGGSGIVIIRYLLGTIPATNYLTNEPVVIAPAFTETIRSFTHSGGAETQTTHTITVGQNTICDILVVAGGGGGGFHTGGGGGAGGYYYQTNITIPAGTYIINVGNGGIAGPDNNTRGGNGGDTAFYGITAKGGGGGASDNAPSGNSGGSGGGADWNGTAGLDTDTNTEGNNGGTPINIAGQYYGSGGGGAGSAGFTNGNGGAGKSNSITGTNTFYAAGGGGGRNEGTNWSGIGGSSIGGNGGNGTTAGTAGLNGTGSGGGGGGRYDGIAGKGGSGIVIIKFKSTTAIPEGNPITHKTLNFAYFAPLIYNFTNYNTEASWKAYAATIPNFTYFFNFWFNTTYGNNSIFAAGLDIGFIQMTLPSGYNQISVFYGQGQDQTNSYVRLLINGVEKQRLYNANNTTTYSQLYVAGDILRIEEEVTSMTSDIVITLTNTNYPNQYTLNFPVPTIADINNNSNIVLRGAYDIALSTTNAIITPKTGQYIPKPTTFASDLLSIRYNILNPLNDPTGAQWAYNTSNMNVCRFGNVGIGTTNPDYSLDVSGSVNAKSYYLNGRQINEPLSELGLSEGMIAQVRHLTYTQMDIKNNTGWDVINDNLTTGFVIAITPKSNLSKILLNIIVHIGLAVSNYSVWWGIKLYRKIGSSDWTEVTGPNGTETGSAAATAGTPVWISNTMYGGDGDYIFKVTNVTGTYLDSPNTTSTVYYTAYWNNKLGDNPSAINTIYLNRAESHGDAYRPAPSSSWTASEIWYG